MKRLLSLFIIVLFIEQARAAENLADRLRSAKPGTTVTLPAGEFRGGVTLPVGVKLKGAGVGKTIIDASGAENGIKITGNGSAISDLTVRGASGVNILVQGGEQVVIQWVRSTGSALGVSVTDSRACRVENVISDNNLFGIVVAGGADNVVVNCTAAKNVNVGLSFPSGKGTVAFNNCVTDSATAVYVGEQATGLVLDYNLYTGLSIGKFHSECARLTLNSWRYLTGLDAHSVSLPVFYDENFAATNLLEWALDRTVTTGWGAEKLAGQSAPGNYLGAVEWKVKAPRPPDGKFEVVSGEGLTSAGVFDSTGKLVTYLFQGLPLRKGSYSFWLPGHSYKGREIPAGDYEVRLVEGKLDWEYVDWIANTDTSGVPGATAPMNVEAITFDETGRLFTGRRGSEEHVNVHAYEGVSGKWLWRYKGNSLVFGLAVASDGLLYAFRPEGPGSRVTRFDPATGKIAPWGKTDHGSQPAPAAAQCNAMVALGEQLFYTDPVSNALRIGTIQSPNPTKSVAVNAPSSPSADAKRKIIWMISGGEKVVAVSVDGKILGESQPVAKPVALAARDGLLAVASDKTGKVHLFDATDPAKLKETSTIGRGDGPDGLVLPDRFLFQDGTMAVRLAFGPNQELAVAEEDGRLLIFDRAGKALREAWSGGWALKPSKVTPGRIHYGRFTMLLDSDKKTWRLEAFQRGVNGMIMGDAQIGGKTFLGFARGHEGISIAEFKPGKITPATGIVAVPFARTGVPAKDDPWTYRMDSNGDGVVDTNDTVVANVTDANGKPVTNRRLFDYRLNRFWPNGDITIPSQDGWLTRWPCAGLDERGHPIYRFQDRIPMPNDKGDVVSPYTLQPQLFGAADHEPRPDGGWVILSGCSGNPARSWVHNGGVDVFGVDKNNVVDWVHPFGAYNKIGSLDLDGGLYIASLAETYDFFVLNADGLLLPGFCFPERAHYQGHWVDHEDTVVTFLDKAGRVNLLTCDYVSNRNHWFILEKKDVREAKFKFTVSPATAGQLAALPVTKLDPLAGKPGQPRVRIPRLEKPLPIDGDLQKWRDLALGPPIVITPEASMGIEGGAPDCSTLVRLAYHGNDLYLQALRFDDVITAHQPRGRAYLQDTVEFSVNGILEGVKHNLSLTTDAGPVNQLDGRRLPARVLDQTDSPLVIKILDNAESVTERQLIESIFGVSLRNNPVQVFETKIPLNEKTYAGRPEARFDLTPGKEFWFGFLIDDNDDPGADLQNFLYWPATYGNFNPVESGAIGVCE